MLEQEGAWAEYEETLYYSSYKEGYQLGAIEYDIMWVKFMLRESKKYEKLLECGEDIAEEVQKRHDIHVRCMQEERVQDVIRFLKKYPSLSKSQLAKRILWESEYWY